MSDVREEIIRCIKENPDNAADSFIKLQKEFKQLQKDKAELVKSLDGAADTLAWFGEHDFALSLRIIANKHNSKGEDDEQTRRR